MVSFNILFLLISIPAVSCLECGVPTNDPFDRIIGGEKAVLGEFPWLVSLQKMEEHVCGATIITDQWVVTAAHCLEGLTPLDMVIIGGRLSIYKSEPNEEVIEVEDFYLHPDYRNEKNEFYNDIAMLKLSKPINFDQLYVRPICLPSEQAIFTGTCELAGWGNTIEGGDYSDYLLKVQVPIISDRECRNQFKTHDILDYMICTWNKKGGKDACQGDSGGPLMCMREDGKYYLTGVVSWGVGCGHPNYPGVCTEVSHFLKWIQQTMQDH